MNLDDIVVASDYACSMGGSQIWLKPGEEMTVDDILKAVAISSANDASVAIGEHIAGTNDAFVDMMNIRAQELGMENTHFLNCNGLDEPGHLTTARDIAIMSRELMKHPRIQEYTTSWTDSLRGGATELVNTNRLMRFYGGTTGLKTGTANGVGSCFSATAERDGLGLVSVVMGCVTSDDRFNSARSLLDYGFANYTVIPPPPID
jgi:D-alanyl-D-alanine carboxypeptidase (penicillin-binding protein 5/6)